MLGRAITERDTAELEAAAGAPSAARAPLSVLVISPGGLERGEIPQLVREALPTENLIVCLSALEAISRAETAQHFGRSAAMFLFDFRGKPVADLVQHLKLVKTACRDAELVVVADSREGATFTACVQVTARIPPKKEHTSTPPSPKRMPISKCTPVMREVISPTP